VSDGCKTINRPEKIELLTVCWDALISDRSVYDRVESTLLKITYLTERDETEKLACGFCDWDEQLSNLRLLWRILFLVEKERWDAISVLRTMDIASIFPAILFDLTCHFNDFDIDLLPYREWVTKKSILIRFEAEEHSVRSIE